MTATADLTFTEIAEKIDNTLDPDMKAYVQGMEALPNGITFSEWLNKLLIAARVAQAAKNTANTTAATGERLNVISALTNGTPTTDTSTGLTFFLQSITVSVNVPANQGAVIPARN
jgi:hypothetical protein